MMKFILGIVYTFFAMSFFLSCQSYHVGGKIEPSKDDTQIGVFLAVENGDIVESVFTYFPNTDNTASLGYDLTWKIIPFNISNNISIFPTFGVEGRFVNLPQEMVNEDKERFGIGIKAGAGFDIYLTPHVFLRGKAFYQPDFASFLNTSYSGFRFNVNLGYRPQQKASFPFEGTLVIPPGQTKIKKRAFYNENHRTVIIPHGVTSIGKEAFARNRLFRVMIPESCTEIAPDAFDSNVQLIYMRDTKGDYVGDYKVVANDSGICITNYIGKNMKVIIPREINGLPVTEIGARAFAGKGLASVEIPDTVTVIDTGAFEYNFLKQVTIPDSIENIPNVVFHQNRLENVVLSNNLKSIGDGAFWNNLLSRGKGVVIPDSVESIHENAFNRLHVNLTGHPQFARASLDYKPSLEREIKYLSMMSIDGNDPGLDVAVTSPGSLLSLEEHIIYLEPGKHTLVIGFSNASIRTTEGIPIEVEFSPGGSYKLDVKAYGNILEILLNGIVIKRVVG